MSPVTPASIDALRFLVVEDHPFQRWFICNMLHEMGAKWVFPAANGSAALEILSRRDAEIDIVVSDLDMPGMDGMELIRHMAEGDRTARLIVVSSAGRDIITTVHAMAVEYGVRVLGAVEKPLTARKLAALLEGYESPAAEADPSAPHFFSAREVAHGLREQQFETYFQPKVELVTGEVRGAEALLRWHHPGKGLIQPVHFIGSAEIGGVIDDLTLVVARDAAQNCVRWLETAADMTVSVNVSPASLADVMLADRLADVIAAAQLDARHLIVEITESAATADVGRELENLSRLRLRGFGLSIDDYGTGYSSMERLARVPFTELKIDRSFVASVLTHGPSRAIVESSLELAAKLGIDAVAEGVETREQWELLLCLGCRMAQGFLVAPPMTAAEFGDWMAFRKRSSA